MENERSSSFSGSNRRVFKSVKLLKYKSESDCLDCE
jgi:hypothetical protein